MLLFVRFTLIIFLSLLLASCLIESGSNNNGIKAEYASSQAGLLRFLYNDFISSDYVYSSSHLDFSLSDLKDINDREFIEKFKTEAINFISKKGKLKVNHLSNKLLSKFLTAGSNLKYEEFGVPRDYDGKCSPMGEEQEVISVLYAKGTLFDNRRENNFVNFGGPGVHNFSISLSKIDYIFDGLNNLSSQSNIILLDYRGTGTKKSFLSEEIRGLSYYYRYFSNNNTMNPNQKALLDRYLKKLRARLFKNSKYISSHHQACDVLYINSKHLGKKKINFTGGSYGGLVLHHLNNVLYSLDNKYQGQENVLKNAIFDSPFYFNGNQFKVYDGEGSLIKEAAFVDYAYSLSLELARSNNYIPSKKRFISELRDAVLHKNKSFLKQFCSAAYGFAVNLDIPYHLFNPFVSSLYYLQFMNDGYVDLEYIKGDKSIAPDSLGLDEGGLCFKYNHAKFYFYAKAMVDRNFIQSIDSDSNSFINSHQKIKNISSVNYVIFHSTLDGKTPYRFSNNLYQDLVESYNDNLIFDAGYQSQLLNKPIINSNSTDFALSKCRRHLNKKLFYLKNKVLYSKGNPSYTALASKTICDNINNNNFRTNNILNVVIGNTNLHCPFYYYSHLLFKFLINKKANIYRNRVMASYKLTSDIYLDGELDEPKSINIILNHKTKVLYDFEKKLAKKFLKFVQSNNW